MKKYALCATGIVLVAIYLFPLYWMFITALKDSAEIFAYPPTFFPQEPNVRFAQVWVDLQMGRFLINSLIIAAGSTAIVVLLGTGCAYALARVRGFAIDAALFSILMMQVLPSSLMATPIFVAFSQTGLMDTPRLAVILAQAAKSLPFYIVLCRATFVQLPKDLEEAALLDGHSRLGAFVNIMLPLARNGILVTSVLVFLQSFGEYVYARSLISQREFQPATVGLQSFMGPNMNDWPGIMAYAVIYIAPILALFVLLQRRIVSGLTEGAIK
jgi:multiple sugar transport system permease protein